MGSKRFWRHVALAVLAAGAVGCRAPQILVRIENHSELDVGAVTCSLVAEDGVADRQSSAALRAGQAESFRSDVAVPVAVVLEVAWRAGEPAILYELGRLPARSEGALVELLQDRAIRFTRAPRR